MEPLIWHFPPPLKAKLNKKEEQQLFYRLADDFSTILNREVIINNHLPIRFDDRHTSIYYRAKGFELTILIAKNWLFNSRRRYLKIAYLMVEPKNEGIGSKIVSHFIQELSATTIPYIALDTINDDGRRFWRRHGFKPAYNGDSHLDWCLFL